MDPVSSDLPRYDRTLTWQQNHDRPIEPVALSLPPVPGRWTFCGRPVESPLGIAAGPLLNGRWLLYYASLGFDVLTFKTVRSRARACYSMPNLVPVETGPLTGDEQSLPATDSRFDSWAVSFGMPSVDPEDWQADLERTRRHLPAHKVLSVSVVGTVQPGWSIDDLADDYAGCARQAVKVGADTIEVNFSCPNVATCDGQLYQQPADAAVVAQAVREAIGDVPLIVKIGHVRTAEEAHRLLDAISRFIQALAMTNSVAATVMDADGRLLFNGERRGICGAATYHASLAQTRLFHQVLKEREQSLALISVGGISSAAQVRECLAAGAEAVHLATAAMLDPAVGLKIRQALSSGL